VFDAALIGKKLTVVEQVVCFGEGGCKIASASFAKVIRIDIRNIAVADARRLVVGCQVEACVELMIGIFDGNLLRLTSSTDYSQRCSPLRAGEPTMQSTSADRMFARCRRKLTEGELSLEISRLASEMQQQRREVEEDYERARERGRQQEWRFELGRGQEDVAL
jgi:hypothetical protein